MDSKILGLGKNTFFGLILVLLLVILGLLSFNYYVQLSGKNGIKFGTGIGLHILPGTSSGGDSSAETKAKTEEGYY